MLFPKLKHPQPLLGRGFPFLKRFVPLKLKGGYRIGMNVNEEKWKKKYPDLIYKEHLFTEGRVIIVDRHIPQEPQEQLLSLETKDGSETVLLKAEEMAKDLDMLLVGELSGSLEKKDSLFVFPGHGAIEVKTLSTIHEGYLKAHIPTKRSWEPGSEPRVKVGEIKQKGVSARRIKKTVVLDDVISSGQTLLKLYEKNFRKFRVCRWFGGSWITQLPRMKETTSGVQGYEKIITAIVIEGPEGKRVPVNSIGSLLRHPEITQSYAHRHFRDSSEFLKTISTIKQILYIETLKTKAE